MCSGRGGAEHRVGARVMVDGNVLILNSKGGNMFEAWPAADWYSPGVTLRINCHS
jgi:hypothetical protein